MRYKDLIQFDPIESVVELRAANIKEKAEQYVKTYVMSDGIADSLTDVVIPQLQFENTLDNKGVFIVGNYGTGKSHLMSVISSIAENKNLLKYVKNDKFKEKAKEVAGKFEVVRFDIGSSRMSLRDIVLKEIEKDLHKRGIEYKFPAAEEVTNNKDYLAEMMGLFEEKYPNRGYLLIIDELLDYLLTRKEMEVMLDLGFLREMGEISKTTRIRFMTGVQETLFDNPKFAFVAKMILKVKDRFEQIIIKREDIAYVVSERLLKKDDEQKSWIREHLQKFSSLYKDMGDKMEEYVKLYPVHPSYLETFEKVYVAEKREVLKTITLNIKKLMEEEVPEEDTGLISYDYYWDFIKNNPSMRTDPDIKEVVDKSGILESIVQSSYTKPQYKTLAMRTIKALSVHRLTTGDVYSHVGVTIENLKNDLCLYTLLPEMEEDFLLTTLETMMREVLKTVSGQFIGFNEDNEQYYLDLKKDIDYNQKIQDKAEFLDDDKINEYYYKILIKALDWNATEYVTGHKIWEYELLWQDNNVSRNGYLFMGGPNERPTAQPAKDFYVYFIKPYGDNKYDDENRDDEVFIEFIASEKGIKQNIVMFTAALQMADISTGESKKRYLEKANKYQTDAVKFMRKNINQSFKVKYKGESKNLLAWLKGKRLGERTLKEYMDLAASNCLTEYFKGIYKEYPKFSLPITSRNMNDVFKAGLMYIAGNKNQFGTKILDSLQLLDGDLLKPSKSKYAIYYLDMLDKLPEGKVLNREDILERVNDDVEYDKKFKLEHIWVTLILSALVYSGDIVLSVEGKKFNATMLKELALTNTGTLIEFKYIEKPKDIPVKALKKLFEFLNLAPGLIINAGTREKAVINMQSKVEELIDKVIRANQFLRENIDIWGKTPIEKYKIDAYKDKLNKLKDFLDSLKIYNTQAKLKNFKYIEEQIVSYEETKKILLDIDKIKEIKNEIEPYTTYLSGAELLLKDEAWLNKIDFSKTKIETSFKKLDGIDENFVREFINELVKLKEEYIQKYLEEHKKHRLDLNGDKTKKKIIQGKTLNNLKKLTAIEGILSTSKLDKIQNSLAKLKTCYNLTSEDMKSRYICPHCNFNPSESDTSVYGVVENIEESFDKLYDEWTEIILNSIEDPMVKSNIEYLSQVQQDTINTLLDTKMLPENIDNNFINAVNTLMKGLEKVEVSADEIKTFISGDKPVTIEELKRNFERYIEEVSRGKDKSKIRIIIK